MVEISSGVAWSEYYGATRVTVISLCQCVCICMSVGANSNTHVCELDLQLTLPPLAEGLACETGSKLTRVSY